MSKLIPAVELIYRALASPKPVQPTPARATTDEKPITLTRADVDAIIQRTRIGTPEDLEAILANAKDLRLTPGERNQIGCDLSIIVAQRARKMNGRRDNPNSQFIAQVLGYMETPVGLVDRSFVDGLLRDGAQNIARCKRHQPPKCECWSSQRAILWQAQANVDKSPESWAAGRIYEVLEDLELSSRPEKDQTFAYQDGYRANPASGGQGALT